MNMEQLLSALLLGAFCLCLTPSARNSAAEKDHLVPINKPIGSSAAYEQLWKQKLLVTPGDIATFVGLPGSSGVETAVSVYRVPGKDGSLPGNYWVTATQSRDRLWNRIGPGGATADLTNIDILKCDAPITESAAIAVRKSWLAVLSKTRPQRESNVIRVDSSRELFSVVDDHGTLLEGQNLDDPTANVRGLIDVALSLLEYCGVPADRRPAHARKIEKAASGLLGRIHNEARGKNGREQKKRSVDLGKSEQKRPACESRQIGSRLRTLRSIRLAT
jgi:hypothetical protein